jgi:carbon starvation protein CstA
MLTFIISLAILIVGYFTYGKLVERIFGIEPQRPTPAMAHPDGVDYVPLPTWKVFLIQFLNIAGMGPIFGAIMGIMYGPAAFIWIVCGTVFAGAVHDFTSAMISLRSDGLSIPEVVGRELGVGIKQIMRVFTFALLVLIGAVFVVTPSEVIAGLTPDWFDVKLCAIIIFIYYILATMLPIDKLIGQIYPLFGAVLLFMALGLLCYMLFSGIEIPDGMADGLYNRRADATTNIHPIFPMLCISIACGAISGFHATQSPMMAKCLKNERYARPIFYGAMVTEGIIALIWAAAAITFTGGYPQLAEYMANGHSAGTMVTDISFAWLGKIGGLIAILGVVAAPISTGDTALRSCRLTLSEVFHLPQQKIVNRLILCIPIFAVTFILMMIDFEVLWRYFAWCNQTLATFTLWACTVYLARNQKFFWITLVPALFMQVVTVSYILLAPAPEGFALPHTFSFAVAAVSCVITIACFARFMRNLRSRIINR